MARPLIDAHHIGLHQTGNEVWALNVLQASEARHAFYDYALSRPGRHQLNGTLRPDQEHLVSGGSARRLAVDLPRHILRLKPSAVMVHYTRPVICPAPLVVLVHDCSFKYPEAREWLPPKSLARYRASVSASVRTADACLVPSEFVKQDLIRFYRVDANQIHVAPCAVSPDLIAAMNAVGPQPRKREVLMVGDPLPRKNLRTVVDAVALMRASGDDVQLKLVGKIGPRGAPSAEYARAKLGNAFLPVGYVDSRGLARAYLGASVLAYPSLSEGFGIPVLEAMAARLPCVVSDQTSLPEVAGNAAPSIPVTDVQLWRESLSASLDHPERWQDAGLKRLAAFSWDKTAEIVQHVLDEVSKAR